MKTLFRAVVVLALLLAMLLAVSTVMAQGPLQNLLNGKPTGKSEVEASGVDCAILNSVGNQVTTIHVADGIADEVYYLDYISSGKSSTSVSFTVKPAYKGSPLATEKQVFHPNSSSDIVTPFGIPSWNASATSGQWKLIVSNNLGQSHVCLFTVVAP